MTKFWINAVASTAAAAIAAVLVWILASGPAVMPIVSAAGSCETLTTLTLPGGTVTLAQPVAAGGFVQPDGAAPARGNAAAKLQSFCRVAVTLKPSTDSDIKMEIWMPVSGWNGKYQAVGNGAFNGNINYGAMMTALARGRDERKEDTSTRRPSPATPSPSTAATVASTRPSVS